MSCTNASEHQKCTIQWCDLEGNPSSWAGPLPSVNMVANGKVFASARMLKFRDPNSFVAGNLSHCLPEWISALSEYPKKVETLHYLSQGVDVTEFFIPFR